MTGIRSVTVHDGSGFGRSRPAQVRRRDRHGRGLRGSLVPPGVPLHRTRAERFDDLVLLAVSQLEPRWEAELSGVEFGVEEIPPVIPDNDDPEPIPLARLEPGSTPAGDQDAGRRDTGAGLSGLAGFGDLPGLGELEGLDEMPELPDRPARIVLYRRPLLARADGQEELAELVLDVIVEQFAHWLGVDPQIVDPGYPADE
jgi:Zincin-like metallopeptidase